MAFAAPRAPFAAPCAPDGRRHQTDPAPPPAGGSHPSPLPSPPRPAPPRVFTLDLHPLMTAVSINSQRVPLRGCGARAGEQPAAGARPLRTSVAPPALPRAEGPPFSSDSDSPFLPQENLRSDKAIKLSGTNKQARICTDAGYTPSNPAWRGGNLPSPCPYQPWLRPRADTCLLALVQGCEPQSRCLCPCWRSGESNFGWHQHRHRYRTSTPCPVPVRVLRPW